MRELLLAFARALVEEPGSVRVSEEHDAHGSRLLLRVAPGDRGRVIGKRGRTADALRALVDVAARRAGATCDVEIA